jgi:lysophospholipase L1-like esterase
MASDALLNDPFFAANCARSPMPPRVPFRLRQGDRLLLIGDSITETPRHSQIITTYLAACGPELQVEVRNIGKGGETAEDFLERMDAECLRYEPTVATVCYGMNDSAYANNNRAAADRCARAIAEIVGRLQRTGARVLLASPGCIGMPPPWPFVAEADGTLDGLNTTLLWIRDAVARLAEEQGVPFVDHFWNLYRARYAARELYGPGYALCGAFDGVHPSSAGHVVMAHGLMTALGLSREIGCISVDLGAKCASATSSHEFTGEVDGRYTFVSRRYPFCAEGLPDKDWSIRSGMTLVPFDQDFNRLTLRVTGLAAPRYRVFWSDEKGRAQEWHEYEAAQLAEGINLADEFQLTPFARAFRRIDDLVYEKQAVESGETWQAWEGAGQTVTEGLALLEARRTELAAAISEALVPVAHTILLQEARGRQ